MRKLLTTGNPKGAKSTRYGYLSAFLHLAPASLASATVGRMVNLCPWSSPGCRSACLNTAGRGGIIPRGETTNAIQLARLERSRLFLQERGLFLKQLERELENFVKLADHHGLAAVCRLNATSDLPFERIAPHLLDRFHGIGGIDFYDYTKSSARVLEHLSSSTWPDNYSLTFSQSEENEADCVRVLQAGGNVATVFRHAIPPTHLGFLTFDGDQHDLRFLDRPGRVVGLLAKGKAKRDTTGFVK